MGENETTAPETVTTEAETAATTRRAQPKPHGIEDGCYRLVGWGIDTTGRRLIDEICHLAAYTPDSEFKQYIMPFSDLSPVIQRRTGLRVVSLGRYRMLKNLKINRYVKTKSEVSALTDFIEWLEKNRGGAADKIILVYHEFLKISPGMLLEALRRHHLIDRFCDVVKGFLNGFTVAEEKCCNTTKSFSLRVMSKLLLDKEDDLENARNRAQAAYEIVTHLAQGERPDLDANGSGDSTGEAKHVIEFVRPFTNPVAIEQDETAGFKVLLERQNTFRPVFGALMRATTTERRHATHLRRLLAENNIDYNQTKAAYDSGAKTALEEVLKKEIANANEQDLTELIEILDCFFDPEKKPVEPKPKFFANNRPRRGSRRPPPRPKEKSESNNNTTTTDSTDPAQTEIQSQPQPEPAQPVEVPA